MEAIWRNKGWCMLSWQRKRRKVQPEDSSAICKKCDVQTKEGVLDLIESCCFEQTRHSMASAQPRLQPQIRAGLYCCLVLFICFVSAGVGLPLRALGLMVILPGPTLVAAACLRSSWLPPALGCPLLSPLRTGGGHVCAIQDLWPVTEALQMCCALHYSTDSAKL